MTRARVQRGVSVLMVIAVVAVLGIVLVVMKERSHAAARAEAQRAEQLALRQAKEEEIAREAAAERERQALQEQERQRQQATQDVLQRAYAQFDDMVSRFEDAKRVAGTTSRIALAQPVGALQALNREARQLTAPPCLQLGKDHMLTAMEQTVEGFLVFMRNEHRLGDTLAQVNFMAASEAWEKYRAARASCPSA